MAIVAAPRSRCSDCRKAFQPSTVRPERCKDCHRKHYRREYRRQYYHNKVKASPEKLEAHRTQCRDAMQRWRDRRKPGALDLGHWEVFA